MPSCLLAIDQGTTSSRAVLFNKEAAPLAIGQKELKQHYPHQDWVEHDPETIWADTCEACREALKGVHDISEIAAVGITNQRETTFVWDRQTGEPLYPAIVWQDSRTASLCRKLKKAGKEQMVRNRTGLLLDPYFSATKLAWVLDHVEGARKRAEAGDLAFGTVDTFLLWRLTGGKVHATDATNASRTLLYNIHENQWDEGLLRLFNIPSAVLPEVRDSADDYGHTDPALFGAALPIRSLIGDQQAATVGQACFAPGQIKSTYGTGCFIMLNTGEEAFPSEQGLLTTIAYRVGGKTVYGLEGAIFTAGAAIQWLRDGLGLIENAWETETLARSIPDTGGVYMVPAFTGLGAPYWMPEARGALFGLTRGTGPAEIARAALESVAYQTHDLLQAMASEGVELENLRIDGGMAANDWFARFLADIIDVPVARPEVLETTALGAAFLAGLQVGMYESFQDIAGQWREEQSFHPAMSRQDRQEHLFGWSRAVARIDEF